jgi:hypothetical protein
MIAINDSFDEEVDETVHDRPEIKKIFHHIKRDGITPKEGGTLRKIKLLVTLLLSESLTS